jgi:nicotinate-nucleotide adenylyltransferase
MCELSVAGADGMSVCALEIDRGGPSYTVDTLNAIHASHPDAELTFIVGADTASTLSSWREPEELLGLAALAVAARTGSAREAVLEELARIGGGEPAATAKIRFLEMPPIAISSSLARHRAARGEPVEDLLGAAVAGYIAEHELYRTPAQELS